jgi:serine/threonine protein kinase
VTLKLLSEVSDGDAVVRRLQHQRSELAILAHPNAARCVDVGLTRDCRPYIIREYLRGTPITVHCDQSQSDRSTRQRLLASVVDVMAQAHSRGITHGGLKPSNIFIVNRGRDPLVKVMDFGVRRATPTDDAAALARLTAALS